MKVLITWQIHRGKMQEIMPHFSQLTPEEDQALMGDNIKLIGRWHDLVRGSGAAICETDNVEAVSEYCLHWNPYMDMNLSLVLDDEECKALGKKILAKSS